jgi:hypothetical protein
MHTRKATKYVGMKRRSCRVNQTQQKRKYSESTHMFLLEHVIRQPSLDNSPIWTLLITAEVTELQLC